MGQGGMERGGWGGGEGLGVMGAVPILWETLEGGVEGCPGRGMRRGGIGVRYRSRFWRFGDRHIQEGVLW